LPKNDFDKLLLEAIDEGLASIGESSKQTIYFYLEKDFNLKKHTIPNKIEDFEGAIKRIFGPGADFLEILTMKKLYQKIGWVPKWQESADFTFAKYVAAARRSFRRKRKQRRLADTSE